MFIISNFIISKTKYNKQLELSPKIEVTDSLILLKQCDTQDLQILDPPLITRLIYRKFYKIPNANLSHFVYQGES